MVVEIFVGTNGDVESDFDIDSLFMINAGGFEHVAFVDSEMMFLETREKFGLGLVELSAFRVVAFLADSADVISSLMRLVFG